MYKLVFRLQPVIDIMAMSLSSLQVKFVSAMPDRMFQHRLWRGGWQHYRNGTHGHLNRSRIVARSEWFIWIGTGYVVFLNSLSSANNSLMRSRLFSYSATSVRL